MAQSSVKIIFHGNVDPTLKLECKKVILDCAKEFDLIYDSEIEIIFTDRRRIAELNAKYRDIRQTTDVLSFPQSVYKLKRNILGSIVVCPGVVDEKSEQMTEVLKHGFLHLLGFDHEADPEKWLAAARKIGCCL